MKSGGGEGWLTTDGSLCHRHRHGHRSQITKKHSYTLNLLQVELRPPGEGSRPRFELINDHLIPFSITLTGVFAWNECVNALTGGRLGHRLVMRMVYVWAFCLKITSSALRYRLMLQMVYFCQRTSNKWQQMTVFMTRLIRYIRICEPVFFTDASSFESFSMNQRSGKAEI